MTDKELLYIEDTLGHEQFIRQMCAEARSQVQDEKLKSMISDLEQRHDRLFKSFYSLLSE
ncbi:MAG: hypothetical protein IJ740_16650 [Ruminococcus sp.]|nr:hypothetical protein [Ruminococcus sp.]